MINCATLYAPGLEAHIRHKDEERCDLDDKMEKMKASAKVIFHSFVPSFFRSRDFNFTSGCLLQEYKVALKDHETFVTDLRQKLKESSTELEKSRAAARTAEETAAKFKASFRAKCFKQVFP